MFEEELLRARSFDGAPLEAVLCLPAGAPRGLVVLVHDLGLDRDEGGFFRDLAHDLAADGFVSVRGDWRCHGPVAAPWEEFSLGAAAADLTGLLHGSSSRFPGLPLHVLASGFSAGVSLQAVRAAGLSACSVVLLAPVVDYVAALLPDRALGPWGLSASAAGEVAATGFVVAAPRPVSRQLLLEAVLLDVPSELVRLGLPALVLHGTGDSVVPFESSEVLAESVPALVVLRKVPAAEHGFVDVSGSSGPVTSLSRELVRRKLLVWLDRPGDPSLP